jgi:hypothetical protein
MPNYGYHLARVRGRFAQRAYGTLLPFIVRRQIRCPRDIALDVFSYSSDRRIAEQVVSIRSFLKYAGRPSRFVVVSDGSHSTRSIDLLRRVDDCVSIEQVPGPPGHAHGALARYLSQHPTGKQLALIMSLPRERPALYIDSDVLFFAAAPELREHLDDGTAPAFYLPDCGFSGDERLLHDPAEKADPVNTGMLLLLGSLDWSLGIERFLELRGEPNFFTNQTITHLVMHANGARPFDPTKYVLQLDDQFRYTDDYAGRELVSRHYVDPVRHKFWTSLTSPPR